MWGNLDMAIACELDFGHEELQVKITLFCIAHYFRSLLKRSCTKVLLARCEIRAR